MSPVGRAMVEVTRTVAEVVDFALLGTTRRRLVGRDRDERSNRTAQGWELRLNEPQSPGLPRPRGSRSSGSS